MTRIELQIHDNLITAINKISNISDSGIELFIPEGSVLFDNILNLKMIQSYAAEEDISVQFETNDEIGEHLNSMWDGKKTQMFIPEDNMYESKPEESNRSHKIPLDILSFIKKPLDILKSKTANLKTGKVKFIAPLVLILSVAGIYTLLGKTLPKATAKVTVDAQPLTRSITIRVSSTESTSTEDKILKGTTIESTIDDTKTIDTTGEKLIGETAEGEVYLYNKKTSEITIKKGTQLKYKDGIEYKTKDDVTIEAKTEETDPGDPTIQIFRLGEATVNIEAMNIGEDFNIDGDKELDVKDYDSDEVTAKTKGDIKGGKSETVKVVAEEDLTKLSAELLTQATQKAEETFNNKVGNSQKLINGSTSTTLVKESFSHEVNDETKDVTGNQTVSAVGLVYSETSLNALLDKLVEDLIPEGYVLSQKDRDIQVEVLGNSTDSVLSSTEADIQVTLKTYVLTDVKEEELKTELAGKKVVDAQKILSGVRNVGSYEFNLKPNFPFFRKVPKDINKIELIIETQ